MLPGLRHQDREGAAVAEQGAVQQALRGCGGAGVRERRGAAGGTAVRLAGEHGASRSTCAIWSGGRRARRKPALAQMGVDEIYLGKKQKFITVVSNLDSGEPVWFGRERKKETLDRVLSEAN